MQCWRLQARAHQIHVHLHSLNLIQGKQAVGTNGTPVDDVRVAVLGASGYTGEEVVRLLSLHPTFTITALTGESQAGKVRGVAW